MSFDPTLLQEVETYVINMRRWFHQNPEVFRQEKNTSLKIQEELTSMGIPFELLPPTYGLIATIEGQGDKKIGIRADFDALPVQEDTGLEFCSVNPGVMHACGHDAHAAMLLGAAKLLMANKDKLNGTVKLIFQAEEECGSGVVEVIENLKKDGGLDQIIGLHIWSALPAGEILLKPDAIFAGSQHLKFKIIGQGGHGARPDLVNDPIKAACHLVTQLASIPSNYYDVLDNSVVTFGQIHAGSFGNIFPSEAMIEGTLRHFKKDGGNIIRERINEVIRGIEIMHKVTVEEAPDVSVSLLPILNDPDMIARSRELVKDIDGLEVSQQREPISASDNYGMLVNEFKGIYGILGGGKPDVKNYPQHHPKFDIDESALIKGSAFCSLYVLDYLK